MGRAKVFFVLGILLASFVSSAQTIMPSSVITKLNTSDFVRFNTKDCPGSHGLDVDVYYPACMTFEKGGYQTHTVCKASYEWNDYEMYVQIMISVFNPGVEKVREFKQGIDEISTKSDLACFVQEGGKFLDGGVADIRNIKVPWFECAQTVSRMGAQTRGVYRTYMIPADSGYLMNLQISVSCATDRDPVNDFKALTPMFGRCVVSLTLKDFAQFSKSGAKPVAAQGNQSTRHPVRKTLLPEEVIDRLNRGELKRHKLSSYRALGCDALDVSFVFPAELSFDVVRTGADKALMGVRDWPEYGVRLLMSVTVSDVGDSYVSGLRSALKEMTRRDLAEGYQKSTGAHFIDGGIVRSADCMYSWVDSSDTVQNMARCARMLTMPSRDGKFLTISYCVASTRGGAPTADFVALKPLIERCQKGIVASPKDGR